MPNTRTSTAATHHFINKALGCLAFPATAEDVIAVAGKTIIPLDNGKSATVAELVTGMTPKMYSCAASFYCALSAYLLRR